MPSLGLLGSAYTPVRKEGSPVEEDKRTIEKHLLLILCSDFSIPRRFPNKTMKIPLIFKGQLTTEINDAVQTGLVDQALGFVLKQPHDC